MKTEKPFIERIVRICNRIIRTANRGNCLTLQWNQPVEMEGTTLSELSVGTSFGKHIFFGRSPLSYPLQISIGTPPLECMHPIELLFPYASTERKDIGCCALVVSANQNRFYLSQTIVETANSTIHRYLEYYYVDQEVHIQTTRTSQPNYPPDPYVQTNSKQVLHIWFYALHLHVGWNRVFVSQHTEKGGVRMVEYSTIPPCNSTNFEWIARRI